MTGIPQQPIFAVGQIATDLSDPEGAPGKFWWQGGTAGDWIVDRNIRLSNRDPAMPYCQLTLQEREVISQMHFSGVDPTAIGRRLRRTASTISRELRHNGSGDNYQAVSAQRRAECRRRERQVSRKMDSTEINSTVREGLSQG